ncbi:hypothetical protein B0H67DRAFT_580913 [Lasiosphaeris hirsuta]|uniref:Zn(2)-C6 fungal-type domain-containing protein n=1 Tax=Lasiosphaeris hirsuta TaxID=260670 RepID=A0AA40AGR8_9PEZI|nr:hypothetical protein B0H67DRAFT_580913 [Lasiosphaeris hirsuta]
MPSHHFKLPSQHRFEDDWGRDHAASIVSIDFSQPTISCLLALAMPQHSWSAAERQNPPPRRKSCATCIKAKRRCTLESPSCLRCSQRALECTYPTATGAVPRSRLRTAPPRAVAAQPVPASVPVPVPAALEPTFISSAWDAPSTVSRAEFHHAATGLDGSPLGPMEYGNTISGMAELDLRASVSGDSHSSTSLLPPVRGSLSDDRFSSAIQTRLQYAIGRMSSSVRQMVLEFQTPWCHPSLYSHSMPQSIQDTLASCALHIAKNPVNAHIINRIISQRAEELIASPMPSSAPEVLARAHSILFYQIIRLFDADPRTQAEAEATMYSIEQTAFLLMQFITFKEGTFEPLDYPSAGLSTPEAAPNETYDLEALPTPIQAFWETWAFQESARRTFLIIFFFLRTYHVLRGRDDKTTCDGKLNLCHSFTLSAHLWRARDCYDFSEAWHTKKHFVVKNGDFTETFTDAQGDDVDDFGKIFISTVLGIEEAKSWLAARGGHLSG